MLLHFLSWQVFNPTDALLHHSSSTAPHSRTSPQNPFSVKSQMHRCHMGECVHVGMGVDSFSNTPPSCSRHLMQLSEWRAEARTHAVMFCGRNWLIFFIQVICQCVEVPSRLTHTCTTWTFPFKACQNYDSLGGHQQAICINTHRKMGKALVTVWIHSKLWISQIFFDLTHNALPYWMEICHLDGHLCSRLHQAVSIFRIADAYQS